MRRMDGWVFLCVDLPFDIRAFFGWALTGRWEGSSLNGRKNLREMFSGLIVEARD